MYITFLDIWKEDVNFWKIVQDFVIIQVIFSHNVSVLKLMLTNICMFKTYTGRGVLDSHLNHDELKEMKDNYMIVMSKGKYYTNTERLGEVLMEIMLQEVSDFCEIDVQQNWSMHAHQQVNMLPSIVSYYNYDYCMIIIITLILHKVYIYMYVITCFVCTSIYCNKLHIKINPLSHKIHFLNKTVATFCANYQMNPCTSM